MNNIFLSRHMILARALGIIPVLLAAAASAPGAEFFLRAAAVTNTLGANQGSIVQWGFARDSAFGARDGAVTVPGPTLTVPPGDASLVINLDNDLAEPVSIVIQGMAAAVGQAPVRNAGGRVTAFSFETPSGNAAPVTYTWNNLRPGTFLYHSGSHPAIQRPMGLYGAVIRDYQAGSAYSNVVYDRDLLLFYSEVDQAINQAVSHGAYGPGKTMTSTISYEPRFYLLNGQISTNGVLPMTVSAGERILLRFVNAGSHTRMPALYGDYIRIVTEDGFLYPFPAMQYSLMLTPHKTMDAILSPGAAGRLALYDRRGVSNPPAPTDSNENGLPDYWEEAWFGGWTNGAADADVDGDGFSNRQEYQADTNPTNAASHIRLANISVTGGQQVLVHNTSPSRAYRLFSRDGLDSGLGPWQSVTGHIAGNGGDLTMTDTNAPAGAVRFYKVDVDLP
ncbi:MAG: multicopper oxidase domain-containing protein [Kiritimatiellia bacterium]